ncbi:MAG: SCO family protein [Desulfuromonadaceae bacterium]|nr:SCO family protein [Desulfuromonadaceae bacterium]MDD2856123.1 SCO family protein [Desulfuromonadaceae bacterium]
MKISELNQIICCIFFAAVFMFLNSSEALAESRSYKRSVEKYNIPDISLVNQNGKKVRLRSLLYGETPVVVDFIYGTCTTICPVLSAGFVNLQRNIDTKGGSVRLVSITIDPENDTPKVMKEYLKRFRAKPGWDFLTGSRADIDTVMKAFNAYIPDKMQHYPLNIIRNPKDNSWVRLFGIMSSKEFMEEFQAVAGKHKK